MNQKSKLCITCGNKSDRHSRCSICRNGPNKPCSKCGGVRTRKHSWCVTCRREYDKENKEVQNFKRLHKTYGISKLEYEILIEQQNNKCAVCGNSNRSGRSLSVDHDHKSGYVRGLLCFACNRGIGSFRDNVVLLRKAMKYISNHLLIKLSEGT